MIEVKKVWNFRHVEKTTVYNYVGLGGVENGHMWGVSWCHTHTMLGHLCFMFHRVILPTNGIEFCQQFNGDAISSLALLYNVVQQCTIILVIKLITIFFLFVFVFVFVFVLISASTDVPSDNILYPYLTSNCTVQLLKDPRPYYDWYMFGVC